MVVVLVYQHGRMMRFDAKLVYLRPIPRPVHNILQNKPTKTLNLNKSKHPPHTHHHFLLAGMRKLGVRKKGP